MTTNLSIHDREYDLEAATRNTQLNILVSMQKKTGVTLKDVILGLTTIGEKFVAAKLMADSGDPGAPGELAVLLDFFSNEEQVNQFRGLVWLCKTQAGERAEDGSFLTLDAANDGIGFTDIKFVNPDEDDEAVEGKGDAGDQPATGEDDLSSSTTSSRTFTPTP